MIEKYVYHSSGLPIRLPTYLRQEIRDGSPMANIQVEMIRNDPRVGNRGLNDVLPTNMAENVRLRRIAHVASIDLVQVAQELGVDSYTTLIHGSVSKGLVRHPSDPDPSDIDICLLLDGISLDREQRRDIAKPMTRESIAKYGAKTDFSIWTMNQLMANSADLVRIYLRSAAYPIANEGRLWERLRWVGLQCECLLQQNQKVRQLVRDVLPIIAQGNTENMKRKLLLRRNRINLQTYQYLADAGLIGKQHAQTRAGALLPAIVENALLKNISSL